ncbi:MAG: ribosome biogenesis GTPase Der [Deltaproteobacteria bacterium]|nr:ribosome biogenesis GTPase Der [Deltaproteobacteria bacterium]
MSKVVIVGRPNVGKSTLFNRMIGKRKAIVYDRPGVTRDRNEDVIQIGKKNITLIDTGGFEFENKGIIEKETTAQIEKAIAEASLLLWVVDSRAGIHPEDQRLSKVLRKLNKPMVLVLNKVDPGSSNDLQWEFEKLGFKNSVKVSAEHGLGMGDLYESIDPYIQGNTQIDVSDEAEAIHVAVVGRPNVGKSSLINALIDQERLAVSEIAGTTRDMIDIAFEHEGQKFVFLDTAGMRYKRKVTDDVEYFSVKRTFEAIDRADVVMLILSGPDQLTTQEEKIAAQIIKNNKPLSIFVNKWDLCSSSDAEKNEFRLDLYAKAKFLSFADVFFISALKKYGLKKIFVQANHLYNRTYREYDEEEVIHAYKTISNYHSQVGRQGHFLELKRLTVDIRKRQSPVFKIKCNRPKLITPAYKKYWKNALIDFFNLRGIPIDVKFRQK